MFSILLNLVRADFTYGPRDVYYDTLPDKCQSGKFVNQTWSYHLTNAIESQRANKDGNNEMINVDPRSFTAGLERYFQSKTVLSNFEISNCLNYSGIKKFKCMQGYVNELQPDIVFMNGSEPNLYVHNMTEVSANNLDALESIFGAEHKALLLDFAESTEMSLGIMTGIVKDNGVITFIILSDTSSPCVEDIIEFPESQLSTYLQMAERAYTIDISDISTRVYPERTPLPSATPHPTPSPSDEPAKQSKTSPGLIAGVTVGSIVIVAGVVVTLLVLYQKSIICKKNEESLEA